MQQVQYCARQGNVRPAPGSDPCTRGPAYWCQSLSNALRCGSGVSIMQLTYSEFFFFTIVNLYHQ